MTYIGLNLNLNLLIHICWP